MIPKVEKRVDNSPPGAFLKNILFGSNLGQEHFAVFCVAECST